jgi:hypothetical protein
MELESRSTLNGPRQELRWSGSGRDYAWWTESIADRWQHAARCATCRGLKHVPVSGHAVALESFRQPITGRLR